MSYALDSRLRARDLYVEEQHSYEQVARETGIALSTLKEWGSAGHWEQARHESLRDLEELKTTTRRGTIAMLKKSAASLNPQDFHAAANMLRALPMSRSLSALLERHAFARAIMTGFLDFVQVTVPAHYGPVAEVVPAYLEANPDLFQMKSKHVKDMREKAARVATKLGDLGKRHGLDAATLRTIREEIYGIIDAGD